MSLLNMLTKSVLGLKGERPIFQVEPNPPGSYHNTYSADGNPSVRLVSTNSKSKLPLPSKLDEKDPSNTSKYRSQKGLGYLDNLPR